MINIYQLRIGNVLQYRGLQLCRVIGINPPYVDLLSLDEKEMRLAEICDEDVVPIPLTENILQKCGFRKMFNHIVRIDDKEYITLVKDTDLLGSKFRTVVQISLSAKGMTTTYFEQTEKMSLMTAVKFGNLYLHQLQNLYYALTGEELKIYNAIKCRT